MSLADRARVLLRKRGAYKSIFMGQGGVLHGDGQVVMDDLARYCYATRTTTMVTPRGGIDPIATAQAEGRRQVYLRILAHLKLNDSAILDALEQQHHD